MSSHLVPRPYGRPMDGAQWLEFVCDRCLTCGYGLDDDPVPRCPRCAIRMTPDDPSIPPISQPWREQQLAVPRASLDDDEVTDRFRDLIDQGMTDDEIWAVVKTEFDFGDDLDC